MAAMAGADDGGEPARVGALAVLQAVGLAVLFAVGAVLGLALGLVIFPISLSRGARAVHAEGIVCRGWITARGPAGVPLAGPALVRLSGAFEPQVTARPDVLGVAIRMQRSATGDARDGDQDVLLGSFESFHTAGRDRAHTQTGDYLANGYSTVTPWWLPGHGPQILRLVPPPPRPAERATDRPARLDADLAAGTARFELVIDAAGARQVIAELRLIERLAIDGRRLAVSMFRQGRRLRPLGLRNGLRATVYPISQIARRMRGG